MAGLPFIFNDVGHWTGCSYKVGGSQPKQLDCTLTVDSGLATLAEHELKLTPHACVFYKQFLPSRSAPLPQLEHATSAMKKKSWQKNKKGRVYWLFPGPAGPSATFQSSAHTYEESMGGVSGGYLNYFGSWVCFSTL